jgi:hypothetical protein
MMHSRYIIDEEVCKKYHLEIPEVLTILLLSYGKTYEDIVNSLEKRGILTEEKSLLGKEYFISPKWKHRVLNIVADGTLDNTNSIEERLETLAPALIEIFPTGRKLNTNKYWRGNVRDIKLKLKAFFMKYGSHYTNEEIINATKTYVESFGNDLTFMRTLPYFIYKDERRSGGEEGSDLANVLDNTGQEDNGMKRDIGRLV